MKKSIIAGAALVLLLTACQPSDKRPTPSSSAASPIPVASFVPLTLIGYQNDRPQWLLCDGGNAIRIQQEVKGLSAHIRKNDPVCKK